MNTLWRNAVAIILAGSLAECGGKVAGIRAGDGSGGSLEVAGDENRGGTGGPSESAEDHAARTSGGRADEEAAGGTGGRAGEVGRDGRGVVDGSGGAVTGAGACLTCRDADPGGTSAGAAGSRAMDPDASVGGAAGDRLEAAASGATGSVSEAGAGGWGAEGGTDGIGACDVVVAVLPGWGAMNSEELIYDSIAEQWEGYGRCPVDFVDVARGFTLATLQEVDADTLWIPDAAGGGALYSAAELEAVGDWLAGGHGGVVATFLLRANGIDDGSLLAQVGLDEAQVLMGARIAELSVRQLEPQPVLTRLSESFTLANYTEVQDVASDWSSALLPGAILAASSADGKSVVVTREEPHRSVYISAFPEYDADSYASARQLVYNAAMWTAGRDGW